MKVLLHRLAQTLVCFAALLLIWNFNTVKMVTAPQVNQVLAAVTGQKMEAEYDTTHPTFYYPRLAIQAPITVSAQTSPLSSQDWGSIRSALTEGVSLNFSGSEFKQASLAYLTGHSSDTYPHPYSSVFAALGQAKLGDTFVLTEAGQVWQYRVISKQVIDPYNLAAFSPEVLGAKEVNNQHVALVTCWPLLTSLNRLVVVGERVGN